MSNKKKLIEYAALLMSQYSYAEVSLDSLINATGVSKSNLYYYYGSKELLGLDVLAYWIDLYKMLDEITLLNFKLTPQNQLENYFDRMILFQIANQFCGNPCLLLSSEIDAESAKIAYSKFADNHLHNLQRFIINSQKTGDIAKKLDAGGATHFVHYSILGAEMTVRAEKSAASLLNAATLISQFLF